MARAAGLPLALLLGLSLGLSGCGGPNPTEADVRRAVTLRYDASAGGDAFTLRNACYEKLGACPEDLGWSYAVDGVGVTEIGERHSGRRAVRVGGGDLYHTVRWWPTRAQLSVRCRCQDRAETISLPEDADVTRDGYTGAWRVTNAL